MGTLSGLKGCLSDPFGLPWGGFGTPLVTLGVTLDGLGGPWATLGITFGALGAKMAPQSDDFQLKNGIEIRTRKGDAI